MIYEYECEKCNVRVEVERSLRVARPAPMCQGCHCRMKRILSPTTFVLQGGGWAADGYK